MISTQWLKKRKAHWTRLETLLDIGARHGVHRLSHRELQELGLLYRQTAADLSTLREDSSGQHLARYLNQLLGRAHNTIYSGRKSSAIAIVRFFLESYPQVFRQTFAYTAVAFILFASSAVAGFLISTTRPEFMHQVLGPQMTETIERREMWTHSIVALKPYASSAIMTNNMSVAFITFASGLMAGLGTIYLMMMNGLLLGIIGTACWLSGMSLSLWSFVAPHGVLELPAIFIAGGAGLLLARGLLFPGTLSRRDSLAVAGNQAVRLVVGTIPLLVVAGIVEGFLSPSHLPVALKFTFAALMAALLAVYLFSKRIPKPVTTNSVL
jgi:uncharacterized membrane protein SpoIIM required for sporulation